MRKFYLLGKDIAYSLSPFIHSEIYRETGEEAEYSVYDTDEPSRILTENAAGFNVTRPYKEWIMRYLDVRPICGACNTVVVEQGKLIGYSTDGEGFVADARRLGLDLSDVLVMGAGGAARSLCYSLKNYGKVTVANRTFSRAERLAAEVDGRAIPYKNAADGEFSLLINATEEYFVDKNFRLPYYDIKYARGGDGLGMLVYQALISAEIFLKKRLDKESLFDKIYGRLQDENRGVKRS